MFSTCLPPAFRLRRCPSSLARAAPQQVCGRQFCNITQCPVANNANSTDAAQLPAKDFAEHGMVAVALRCDHQNIAGLQFIDSPQHRAKIRRLALRGHGHAEQARLLSSRAQGPDGGIDLASSITDIGDNGRRDFAPTLDFDWQ